MHHIVHLTTVHLPFDTRIFQRECTTLSQAGYQVSLIATHTKPEVVNGIKIIPLPKYRYRALRILLAPWNAYKQAQKLNANIYHFHDPELLLIGVLLKLTTHARVIYDVHENHSKKVQARSWLFRPLRKFASLSLKIIEIFSIRFFDSLVTATEHIAELFPKANTLVIKNYPLLEMNQTANGTPQYNPDNRILIYTGGWTDHRGIYQVIQALEYTQTPNIELVLLGRTIDKHVQERAQTLPAYSKIKYLGQIPYHQVYQYLKTAAIGFVCNQPEHDYDLAQPNKLFEYMSAGLPVIASKFPLWQEIVEGHNCGVTVDPTKPEEIAKATDYLLSHPELRKQMGENGRHAVRNIYNWGVEAKKLINLYRSLLS